MKKLLLTGLIWLGFVAGAIAQPVTTQVTQDLWTSQCAIGAGVVGNGAANPIACMPTPSTAGDLYYWNGSQWTVFAGNTSGTACFSEDASGVPTWGSCGATSGVASVGNATSDTTLTIAGTGSGPWTGPVTVKLNLANPNTWSATQTFPAASIPSATLVATTVTAGAYGSSTAIPTFTVNAQGQLTVAGTAVVIAPAGTLTGTTLASNVVTSSLTATGTLTAGATGSGFTLNFTTSTISGVLGYANGGCNATTQTGCTNNVHATPTRAGDVEYWNGTNWVTLAGNNSGTQVLQENSSGVPSWATVSGSGTVTSVTCGGVTITTSGTCAPVGQFPGIASNTAATAGNVGELISSTVLVGSAVSLTTATTANVTSVSLTAGDWDCRGNVVYAPAGTTTMSNLQAFISTTSATTPTLPNTGSYTLLALTFTTGAVQSIPAGDTQIIINSTTSVYLEARSAFAISTMSAYGYLGCRRMR